MTDVGRTMTSEVGDSEIGRFGQSMVKAQKSICFFTFSNVQAEGEQRFCLNQMRKAEVDHNNLIHWNYKYRGYDQLDLCAYGKGEWSMRHVVTISQSTKS